MILSNALQGVHLPLDPVYVERDLGVDAGKVFNGASVTPGDNAAEDAITPLTEAARERTARVALARVIALFAGAHHAACNRAVAVIATASCNETLTRLKPF